MPYPLQGGFSFIDYTPCEGASPSTTAFRGSYAGSTATNPGATSHNPVPAVRLRGALRKLLAYNLALQRTR